MTWVIDKPTQAGWYWVKNATSAPAVVQVVSQTGNVTNTLAPALVVVGYTLTGGEQWNGPLTAPT